MLEHEGHSYLLKEATDVQTTAEGKLKAKVGTLEVVDKHNDMIMKGAIGRQQVALSAFGHRSWMDRAPVGKGEIYEEGNDIIFEGDFFLDMPEAVSTFASIKGLGDLQQYSWSLEQIKYSTTEYSEDEESNSNGPIYKITKVKVREVSPVLRGASIDTRTISVKSEEDKRPNNAAKAELENLRLKHISRTWGE